MCVTLREKGALQPWPEKGRHVGLGAAIRLSHRIVMPRLCIG